MGWHSYKTAAEEAESAVKLVERSICTCRTLAPKGSPWRKDVAKSAGSKLVTAVVDTFTTARKLFGTSKNASINKWKSGARAAVLQRQASLLANGRGERALARQASEMHVRMRQLREDGGTGAGAGAGAGAVVHRAGSQGSLVPPRQTMLFQALVDPNPVRVKDRTQAKQCVCACVYATNAVALTLASVLCW